MSVRQSMQGKVTTKVVKLTMDTSVWMLFDRLMYVVKEQMRGYGYTVSRRIEVKLLSAVVTQALIDHMGEIHEQFETQKYSKHIGRVSQLLTIHTGPNSETANVPNSK